MKDKADVLDSTSLTVHKVSMDVKQHLKKTPFPQLRRCVKVEMDVLDSPSLMVLTVSVDVKLHRRQNNRAQELCGRQGGRPGLPVPNSPHGLCGRKVIILKTKKMYPPSVQVSPV